MRLESLVRSLCDSGYRGSPCPVSHPLLCNSYSSDNSRNRSTCQLPASISALGVSVPHCSTSPCRLSAPPNGSGLSGLGREGAKEEDLLTLFQQLHFFMSRSFTLVLQIHIFFKISYYEIDHTRYENTYICVQSSKLYHVNTSEGMVPAAKPSAPSSRHSSASPI